MHGSRIENALYDFTVQMDSVASQMHLDIPDLLTQCITNAEMDYFALRTSLMSVNYGNGTQTANMLQESQTQKNMKNYAGNFFTISFDHFF